MPANGKLEKPLKLNKPLRPPTMPNKPPNLHFSIPAIYKSIPHFKTAML